MNVALRSCIITDSPVRRNYEGMLAAQYLLHHQNVIDIVAQLMNNVSVKRVKSVDNVKNRIRTRLAIVLVFTNREILRRIDELFLVASMQRPYHRLLSTIS